MESLQCRSGGQDDPLLTRSTRRCPVWYGAWRRTEQNRETARTRHFRTWWNFGDEGVLDNLKYFYAYTQTYNHTHIHAYSLTQTHSVQTHTHAHGAMLSSRLYFWIIVCSLEIHQVHISSTTQENTGAAPNRWRLMILFLNGAVVA